MMDCFNFLGTSSVLISQHQGQCAIEWQSDKEDTKAAFGWADIVAEEINAVKRINRELFLRRNA